jgi:hypothetical protein
MGVEGEDGRRALNVRVLFAALDLPWDEQAPQLFQQAMQRLVQKDGGEGEAEPAPSTG